MKETSIKQFTEWLLKDEIENITIYTSKVVIKTKSTNPIKH